MNSFLRKRSTVCVAVNFDDNAKNLVKTAESICLKTGSSMRIINVVEPWVGNVSFGIVPLPEVSEAVQTDLINDAERKLKELAESVDTSVKVQTNAVLGVIADSIIAEASAHKASVIVTGTTSAGKSFLPSGFSTALSIMGNSPIPVLVVPKGESIDFNSKDINLMIADDLTADGQKVLAGGVDFAAAMDAKLEHVHALGLNKDQLKTAVEAAAANARSNVSTEISSEDYYNALSGLVAERMHGRGNSRLEELERSGSYHASILEGEPAEVLMDFAKNHCGRSPVMVFGRHHTFHRKPFLIGRVPFKAMIASNNPVLVIPPEYQAR